MKVLLIVDVQKSMGHWFTSTYINKLHQFIKQEAHNYDKVITIMEPVVTLPSYRVRDVAKANHMEIMQIIQSLQPDKIPSFIKDVSAHQPIYKMYNKHLFNRMLQLGILPKTDFIDLPSRNKEGIYRMYLSPELKQLVNLTSKSSQVDIVGGGVDKCVSLTNKLLTYHNINSTILRDHCYVIKYVNTNYKKRNALDSKPSNVDNPELVDSKGNFLLTEIHLD